MPLESSSPTLLDLLRSTLSLFEYYDGLEMHHYPVMDEVTACMRRAIAEISAATEAATPTARRPVAGEIPQIRVRAADQKTG